MSVDDIIDAVLEREAGYVNDPDDTGGETKHGITVAVTRAYGWNGPMRELPVALARRIYTDRYITTPKFDQIIAIDAHIAAELTDTGVNMGPHRSAEFLQRWLNGFNDTGSRYQELFVDGRIGHVTLTTMAGRVEVARTSTSRHTLMSVSPLGVFTIQQGTTVRMLPTMTTHGPIRHGRATINTNSGRNTLASTPTTSESTYQAVTVMRSRFMRTAALNRAHATLPCWR